MAENFMKIREREIRAEERAEANKRLADIQVKADKKLANVRVQADREMANAVKSLINAKGWTFEQACQTLGLSRRKQARISQYL